MRPKYFQVMQIPSGGYKVMIIGQADGHFMDWRGCNYRITPVTNQPRRGYATLEEAYVVYDSIDEARKKTEFDRARDVTGQHLGDHSPYQFVDRRR